MNRIQWWIFAIVFFVVGYAFQFTYSTTRVIAEATTSDVFFLTTELFFIAFTILYGLAFAFFACGLFEEGKKK